MRSFFFIFIIIYLACPLSAQFRFIPEYTYLYALTETEVTDFYLHKIQPDNSWKQRKKSDSLLVGKQAEEHLKAKKMYGYYMQVSFFRDKVDFRVVENPGILLKIYDINKEVRVYSIDSLGNFVPGRLQSFNRKEDISYYTDSSCRCIVLKRNKAKGSFVFRSGDRFRLVHFQLPTRNVKRNDWNAGGEPEPLDPGFVITNQSEYKLLDSFYLKAYLMDEYGDPLKEKIQLDIFDNQNSQLILTRVLKRESPGSYHFSWKIPDSLTIDHHYRYELKSLRKGKLYKSAAFKITQFHFIRSFFSASLENPFIFPGKENYYYLSATDNNGIPLSGAMARVSFRITSMLHPYEELLYIPINAYTNLYDTSFFLAPDAQNRVRIPAEIIPGADMDLEMNVRIVSANNESKEFKLYLKKRRSVEEYSFRFSGKQVQVIYQKNQETLPSDSVCLKWTNLFHGREETRMVVLPYTQAYNPMYTGMHLYDKSQKNLLASLGNLATGSIQVSGKKTYDSATVVLENPAGMPLNWEIFFKGKRIAYGHKTGEIFRQALKGNETIHILYSYITQGNLVVAEHIISTRSKELHILHNLPEVVYPGQRVGIEIEVLNFKNKPVRKANITAFSMNTMMPVVNTPSVPYYGEKTGAPVFRIFDRFFGTSNIEARSVFPADTSFRHLETDDIAFYRMFYSAKPWHLETVPSLDSSTQLSVIFTNRNYSLEGPVAVWIDDKLEFVSYSNDNRPNIFVCQPGKHKIKIRGTDRYFLIEELTLEAGKRNFLCINRNSNKKNDALKTEEASVEFSPAELDEFRKQLLFVRFQSYSDHVQILLKQNDKVVYLNHRKDYFHPDGRKEFITSGNFQPGFIEISWKNSLNHSSDTSFSFYFNPGYLYYFDQAMQLHVLPEQLIRYSSFQAVPVYIGDDLPSALTSRWLQLEAEGKTRKERAVIVEQRKQENQQLQQKERINGSFFTEIRPKGLAENYGNLIIDDRLLQESYMNYVWLVSLDKPSESYFISTGQKHFNNLPPGYYRLFTGEYHSKHFEWDSLLIKAGYEAHLRISDNTRLANETHLSQARLLRSNLEKGLAKKPLPIFDINPYIGAYASGINSTFLSGRVVSYNQPVVNAYVILSSLQKKHRYFIRTDVAGYYSLDNIDTGFYQLEIITPGMEIFYVFGIRIEKDKNYSVETDIKREIAYTRSNVKNEEKRVEVTNQEHKEDPQDPYMGSISGKVTDKNTGEGLVSASVLLLKNGIQISGTVSDIDGNYRIRNITPGTYSLSVRYIGYENTRYEPVVVHAGYSTTIHLSPAEMALELREIQVTGMHSGTTFSMVPERHMISLNSIDGITATSFSGFEFTQQAKPDEPYKVNADKEKQRLEEISRDTTANRVRDNFKNNAFWVPTLLTNRHGKTGFTVVYPDDETQWVNFIAGIDKRLNTTLNISYTRSYKPLSASLRLPYHVIKGDRLKIQKSIRNLTGDTLNIRSFFTMNGDSTWNDLSITRFLQENQEITFGRDEDTVSLTYGLSYKKYLDGEERKMAVKDDFILNSQVNSFLLQRGDSAFIPADIPATSSEIIIYSGFEDLVRYEIQQLKRYSYGCVEQTASKLYALIVEKQLKKALGETFSDDQYVVDMIKRLEDFQNSDGSWGWWKGSLPDYRLTFYVAEAIHLATREGYSSKAHSRAAILLLNRLPSFEPEMLIKALIMANKFSLRLDTGVYLKEIQKYNLSKYESYLLAELKLLMGDSSGIQGILNDAVYEKNGAIHWVGFSNDAFNAASVIMSMQAYKVLRMAGGHEPILTGIRKFFFNSRSIQGRNTLERAQVIATMGADAASKGKGFMQLSLDGQVITENTRKPLSKTNHLLFNAGEEISVLVVHKHKTYDPVITGKRIRVSAYLNQKGRKDSLQVSEPVNMHIDMHNDTNQKYMVLEIPVPAGFQVVNKVTSGNETAREYFEDKVIIYYENFPAGNYQLDINFVPFFEGNLTWMPVHIENMYNPLLYAHTSKQKLVIGNFR